MYLLWLHANLFFSKLVYVFFVKGEKLPKFKIVIRDPSLTIKSNHHFKNTYIELEEMIMIN